MLDVAAALQVLLAAERQLLADGAIGMLPTLAANGLILTAAQTSQLNVPPADNTQMDSYAVRAVDYASGAVAGFAADSGRSRSRAIAARQRRPYLYRRDDSGWR